MSISLAVEEQLNIDVPSWPINARSVKLTASAIRSLRATHVDVAVASLQKHVFYDVRWREVLRTKDHVRYRTLVALIGQLKDSVRNHAITGSSKPALLKVTWNGKRDQAPLTFLLESLILEQIQVW